MQREDIMKTRYTVALSVLAGAGNACLYPATAGITAPGAVEFLGCLSELHDEVVRDLSGLPPSPCWRQRRSREALWLHDDATPL